VPSARRKVRRDLRTPPHFVKPVFVLRAPNSDVWVSTSDLPKATNREFWRLKAQYNKEDLDLELFGRRGEHLLQRFHHKLETQLQAVGQLLDLLEGDANSELVDQIRQARLELAKSETSLAELAESQTDLVELRKAIVG
jgi:two-component sensor histidine kinase